MSFREDRSQRVLGLMVGAAGAVYLMGCVLVNGCVARGTLVSTPEGEIPIEQLKVGDEIWAVDETTGKRVVTRIVATRVVKREVGVLEVGGRQLRLTSDHPVFCPVQRKYVPAGDWFLGDRTALAVWNDDVLTAVDVTRAVVFSEVSDVYDITVEHELHNFVAAGIVVHNKSEPPPEPLRCEDDLVRCTCPDGSSYQITACADEACECFDSFDMGPSPGADMSTLEDSGTVTDAGDGDAGSPDTGDAASSADGGPADASTDAGVADVRGSCSSDIDCGPLATCDTLPINHPDGWNTCLVPPVAPNCAEPMGLDECCQHTDCTASPDGACVNAPIFYCGGAAPQEMTACLYDECRSDADCGGEAGSCIPAGAFGEPVSRCVDSQCAFDSDCTGGDGAECLPFRSPCNNRFVGFFCTYDTSECRTDADCDQQEPHCVQGPGDGDTSCQEFIPPP